VQVFVLNKGTDPVPVSSVRSVSNLLTNVTAVTTGAAVALSKDLSTFQAKVAGTGTVTATVLIEVSNNGTDFILAGTITLSGTASANDGFAIAAPWAYARARLTAITGTGATVNVNMGV